MLLGGNNNEVKPMSAGELWKASKEIDGLDAEGTFLLASMRVNKFNWPPWGQYYYEPLKSLEELYAAIDINNTLFAAGVPYKCQLVLLMDFECFKSIFQIENEIVPLPSKDDRLVGRHAVGIIEKDVSDGSIKFINTWGPNWGDNGYGSLSAEYLSAHLKEIFLAMDASVGITHQLYDALYQDCPPLHFAKIWMLKNYSDEETCEIQSERVKIVYYDLITMSGSIVEIFDIVNIYGQRLGWAHLVHKAKTDDSAERLSLINELFVWPQFRRKGYGTLLEKYCCDYALSFGSNIIKMPIYEMDDLLLKKSSVRIFTKQLGYTYNWKEGVMPCVTGIAEKKL